MGFRMGGEDRRAVTRANLPSIAAVPLFVKRPRQRRGRISRAYVRTVDVLPTIADVLNVRVPWRTSGRSAFRAPRRRTVTVATRTRGQPALTMSTGAFQARWGAAIRRQHGLFGFGARGLYGGRHARLISRPLRRTRSRFRLGRARVIRRRGVRAVVSRPHELRVRRRRRFRPALIVGRIVGGARGARRDLAVVMNGYVAGVGRSFHLRGNRGERFAILVPEFFIKPGRNRVRVLSIARRGRRLRLRLLGGA
jgi:hypothetical protein